MNNLFYRERENWFLWLLWGIIGAGFMISIYDLVEDKLLVWAGILPLMLVLSWRMHVLRRYSFFRALKVHFFVFSISTLPLLVKLTISKSLVNDINVSAWAVSIFLFGLIASIFMSFISRSPREYY